MIIQHLTWLYHRDGFFYKAETSWEYSDHPGIRVTINRKIDPVSYWLIRWLHGEEKLQQMASEIPESYK